MPDLAIATLNDFAEAAQMVCGISPSTPVIADADTTTEIVEDIFTAAPRGEFVIEDGELVAKAACARHAAVTSTDDSSASAGDWLAGVLLLGSAAGILWALRGRNR